MIISKHKKNDVPISWIIPEAQSITLILQMQYVSAYSQTKPTFLTQIPQQLPRMSI